MMMMMMMNYKHRDERNFNSVSDKCNGLENLLLDKMEIKGPVNCNH